jgi:DHA2 family multidrug resistance protein
VIDLSTDAGKAMMERIVNLQAQIISFSRDELLILIFILCTLPLAFMISSTRVALQGRAAAPQPAARE